MPWPYVRPYLQDEVIRLRAQLQSTKDDPEQLGGEPILPPFTPNSMPVDQSIINRYSPFRPLARGHAARPIAMVELDMDPGDCDTTIADPNEMQTFE